MVAALHDTLATAGVPIAHFLPIQHFVAGGGDQEVAVGLRDARGMDGRQFVYVLGQKTNGAPE